MPRKQSISSIKFDTDDGSQEHSSRQIVIEPLQSIKESLQKRQPTNFLNAPRRVSVTSNFDDRRMSITQGVQGMSSFARRSIVPTKGPSLVGLLASRKFAKQLLSRHRLSTFEDASSKLSNVVQKEPTYRMEPSRKFENKKVEECMKDVLEDRLEHFKYNPKLCSSLCKILTDEIKHDVKALNYDRYKIVCSVLMGQRRDQGMLVASRCAWDDKLDNFASYTFSNDKIFCTAMVFGVYNE